MSYISSLEPHELGALREHLLNNFRDFCKFVFKIQYGTEMLEIDIHRVIFDTVQLLIDQKSNRMIINIPPRAGKTQIISIFLPLFAWCRNPSAQTILTGFNSDVLFECSGYIRTIMSDPDFKSVFPDVVIDLSKKSVERLGTMSAGVLHAVPTSGKMTGKGAGALVPGFAGILCIDDIIKPDDAMSPVERNKINHRFSNTILSRLATEKTPLVIIMQRLHVEDLCGYLMKGGSSDVYDWLNIPGLITKDTGTAEWYKKDIDEMGYTHVRPILYKLNRRKFDKDGYSSFWPVRKTVETLKGLRTTDPYTFYSQYLGKPIGKGTSALGNEDIHYYDELNCSNIRYTFFTADTASTTKNYSSNTVSVFWGVTKQSELVVIDLIVGKWETPDLVFEMRQFWKKYNYFDLHRPTMMPRGMYMENKASGLFLNQQFLKDGSVTVRPVARDNTPNNDKFSRFLNAIPFFRQGRIRLPRNHEHTQFMVRELLGQSEFGNSTNYDDFVDNVSDAVVVAFSVGTNSYEAWA